MIQDNKERRRHQRLRVPAVMSIWPRSRSTSLDAAVDVGQEKELYLVDNLSISGALVDGGASLPLGSKIRARVDIADEEPLDILGTVVRQEERRASVALAIAFEGLDAATLEELEGALVRAAKRSQDAEPAFVMVLDSDARTRRALREAIQELGYRCVAVKSPVNAISLLESKETAFIAACIDLHLGGLSQDGMMFSDFLAENFPWVRRVLVAGEVDWPQLETAVAEGSIQAALSRPWSYEQLRAVLG